MSKDYNIFAIENCSGLDSILLEEAFVYLVNKESNFESVGQLDGNVEHICDNENCNLEDCSKDLIYAFLLKDLIDEAIKSGLLQKIPRKTRPKI